MSHFCGLVILTPKYSESFGMDDSLAKYDENLETPEYRKCDLSEYDKVRFLEYYIINKAANLQVRDDYEKFKLGFITYMRGKKGYLTQKQYMEKYPYAADNKTKKAWAFGLIMDNKERYADYFAQNYKEWWNAFEDTYKEFGDDWNSNNWHKEADGKWGIYSTYNPDSKWDWYSVGGRWSKSIKTKSGEFVDMAKLDEIDFEPYPDECFEDSTDWRGEPVKQLKDEYEWHYDNKDNVPFCVIIDGVWYERGEMGWWACVSNEKDKGDWTDEVMSLLKDLPADSSVYNVDFHI